MHAELAVTLGGLFNLAFALFHMLFWKLFRWKRELASLNHLNRAVMQVLNLCLTFVFLIFAYLLIVYSGELVATSLGRSLLLLISVFWFLRAVEQVAFFGLKSKVSLLFLLVFLIGALVHLYPLVFITEADV